MIEEETKALIVIDYAHHEVHNGNSYMAHYDLTTSSANDHQTAIGFTTPNTTKWLHLLIRIAASSPAEFSIDEVPTIDDEKGTALVAYNRDRNSSNISGILSLASTAVAGQATSYTNTQIAAASYSAGTIIGHYLLAGGKGPRVVGGTNRGSQEIILKQNTKYLFLMQNIGANANLHEIHLNWYEHTNKVFDI